jgi:hypothetical protein
VIRLNTIAGRGKRAQSDLVRKTAEVAAAVNR